MWKLAGAFGLTAVSLFMLLGFLNSSAQLGSAATVAALALVVGLPALSAGLLIRSYLRERHRLGHRMDLLRQQTIESEIVRLAVASAGRLTAIDVATHMAMTPEQAKNALDQLALRSIADFEVTEQGVIVYHFHDAQHSANKHSAKGLLDA